MQKKRSVTPIGHSQYLTGKVATCSGLPQLPGSGNPLLHQKKGNYVISWAYVLWSKKLYRLIALFSTNISVYNLYVRSRIPDDL